MPKELIEIEKTNFGEGGSDQPSQSVEEINRIIQVAKMPEEGSKAGVQAAAGASDSDDVDADVESEVDVSGDYFNAVWADFGIMLRGVVF